MPAGPQGPHGAGDNGIYVIDGWNTVDRIGIYDGFVEQHEWDFDEIIRDMDRCMPEGERLGEFLDSVEVPASELEIGDEVWLRGVNDSWEAYPVVGFGQPSSNRIAVWVDLPDGRKDVTYPDLPYVARRAFQNVTAFQTRLHQADERKGNVMTRVAACSRTSRQIPGAEHYNADYCAPKCGRHLAERARARRAWTP